MKMPYSPMLETLLGELVDNGVSDAEILQYVIDSRGLKGTVSIDDNGNVSIK